MDVETRLVSLFERQPQHQESRKLLGMDIGFSEPRRAATAGISHTGVHHARAEP